MQKNHFLLLEKFKNTSSALLIDPNNFSPAVGPQHHTALGRLCHAHLVHAEQQPECPVFQGDGKKF